MRLATKINFSFELMLSRMKFISLPITNFKFIQSSHEITLLELNRFLSIEFIHFCRRQDVISHHSCRSHFDIESYFSNDFSVFVTLHWYHRFCHKLLFYPSKCAIFAKFKVKSHNWLDATRRRNKTENEIEKKTIKRNRVDGNGWR